MTGGSLIKLREGRRRRPPIWTVEIYDGERIASSHDFSARSDARLYARGLASKHGAVVVLAGPSKVAPLTRRGGAMIDLHRNTKIGIAAEWLSRQSLRPSPVVPHLQRQFGLSSGEAVEAIRRADLLRNGRAL